MVKGRGGRRRVQRGLNVLALLLAMVLLTALVVGSKVYLRKIEARKEAQRQEQASRDEAARLARERMLAHQQQELDRQAEAARRASIVAQLNLNHEQMLAAARKWDDAVRLSASTPRYALPQVILQMQATRREMDGLKVHNCLDGAKKTVVDGMDEALRGFEAFMRMSDGSPQARNELNARFMNAHSRFQFLSLRMMDCSQALQPPRPQP